MTLWEAVVLGLVQGLTEFLPISSSAHLAIVGQLLPSGADPGAAFTAITQIGTETAVVIYFWPDIVRIIRAWWGALRGRVARSDPDARMGWYVIIGSLPIVILGVTLQDQIESVFRNLYLVAATLAIFALVLGWADRRGAKVLTLDKLTWRDGLLFGFAQAAALIPGVSRSGGTITAGLLLGYTREAAARYSFLLAIPAVMGSGFFQLAKSWDAPGGAGALNTAVATLVAGAVGYVVIIWFLRLVSTHSYALFVGYRLVLAATVLILLTLGVIVASPPEVAGG